MPILNAVLSSGAFGITVSEAARLDAVPRLISDNTDAAIVFLTDWHNAAELRELVQQCPSVRFLLVTPTKPPRAALARAVSELGAAIVSCDEGPLIIVATLLSMLAQSSASPGARR
ncbi:MAG TPA: hypothetical protein VEZ14_01540 [Dehalococcoidia bacterium]|nr:hypothetical protein [Dehalococcoidia bacterium]